MKITTNKSAEPAWLCFLCAMLTGCTVGPKYHPPAIQPPPAYKEAPPAGPPANTPPQSPGNAGNAGQRQLDRRATCGREDPRRLVGDLQRSRAERPGSQLNIDNQTSSYTSRTSWKPARWCGRRARNTSPRCRSARLTTGQRSSGNLGPTSTTANPGKTVADLLPASGCFLDPGPFWQNPQ